MSHTHTNENTATHCNTLQHTTTSMCTDIGEAPSRFSCAATLQHAATHCNTLQHTATHCNTLQNTCNTLQHTTTYFFNLNVYRHWRGTLALILRCRHDPLRRLLRHTPTVLCCSELQCVAVSCSVLQCVAGRCSELQCGAVWCSELQ